MTNSLGVADTNAFRVTPISTPILADGSFLVTGVPVRITPNSNGFAQTNLQRGNYVVSNSFVVGNWGTGVNPIGSQRGVIFAVPNSSGTYSFTSNAISGGNVYNYNGAQFVATYSNIVTELGFTPLSTNDARALFPTNTFAAGNNVTFTTNAGVVTVASTATGGAGTNTISAGTLVTVTTNTPNYVVSALSQTNNFTTITTSNAATFALTNDARILRLTNINSIMSVGQVTTPILVSDDGTGSQWIRRTNAGAILTLATNTGASGGAITIDSDGTILVYGADASIRANGITADNQITANVFSGNGSLVTNVTAERVVTSVTNRWRLDATNAVIGLAATNTYNAGEGLTFSTSAIPVTVSVSAGTTNRFAFTNLVYGVSNNVVTGSNALFGFLLTTSNRFALIFPTNSGTDGQVISKTGTNVQWATASGGSGTGIQTNSGSGTNTILTRGLFIEPAITSTNINLGFTSTISATNGTWIGVSKHSSILGGQGNLIGETTSENTSYDVIGGGLSNRIRDDAWYGFIGAGLENEIQAGYGVFIGGGSYNHADGTASFIVGGYSNTVESSANYSGIMGGFGNLIASGSERSAIAGGTSNRIFSLADNGMIGGGRYNNIQVSTDAFIGAGLSNNADAAQSFIGSGITNAVNQGSDGSGIVAGFANLISLNSQYSFIGGGFSNSIASSADYATIPGGWSNIVRGSYSMAAGAFANASSNYSFVWSDGQTISSGTSNVFIIGARNGVGINTNDPLGNGLNVNGRINAPTFTMMALTNAQVNTNIVVIQGSGTVAVNGMYYYQGPQYTNRMTGATITNNAGTWVIKDSSLTSIDSSTALISTNWTVLVSTGVPRSDYGTFLYGNGPWVGEFFSTNADTRYIHPTNTGTDSQFIVKTGNDSQWSSSAGITNISGNAGTATLATNWLGGNIYVSATGSDSAAGTRAAPLATVSNALTRISGVGSIIVRGGDYFNQTVNLGQFDQVDVRISNYPGEKPNFWYGEVIVPGSFAALSNDIFTTTMSVSFSNALVFYTNRWNINAPQEKYGCLFQTNLPYGTNRYQWVISPTVQRDTETNRMEHTPIYRANSVADMVGATTNSVWFARSNTLYVKFANSTAGGIYLQGTNLSDSFCWGVAPPGSRISISGIRTYMARNGFDVTGASEAKLTGCYAFGSGVAGFLAVNTTNTLEYSSNVYTGSIELSGCEAAGSQIFGLLINALNTQQNRQPWTQAFVHGSSFHDGTRESCTFWGDVRATVTDVMCAFNGMPNGWDLGTGYGLISSAAAVNANGYFSISNSAAGMQLGETGRRSLMFVSNSRFYEEEDCIRMDDTKDVVFSQNNAFYKILPDYNLISVDATATPEHYVEDSGSFAIQSVAANGYIITGTGTPAANTVTQPRVEPRRYWATDQLSVQGSSSILGATVGVLDVPFGETTLAEVHSRYPVAGGIVVSHGTNTFNGSPTNVLGTTVKGQIPITISNQTYYIDMKQ